MTLNGERSLFCFISPNSVAFGVNYIIAWTPAIFIDSVVARSMVVMHKTIGDRAFPVAAARVWNMLPPAITSLPSLQTFKHALKTELFRRSYDNAH